MKRLELQLIPAPGQKPEFLATLELVEKTPIPPLWDQFPSRIILEGYTRDPWALDTSTPHWIKWQVESVDGRNKLPGFIKYLVERGKTAYGRVVAVNQKDGSSGGDHHYAWVIPPKQVSSTAINCRIAPLQHIPNCPLKPISTTTTTKSTTASSSFPPSEKTAAAAAKPGVSTTTTAAAAKPKKSGLLGNLVGAQRRTNQQVQIAAAVAPRKVPPPASSSDQQDPSSISTDASTGVQYHHPPQPENNHHLVGTKTAGQVLAEFRQEMEQEMLDFDISSEPCLKIKIDLPTKLRLLTDEEKLSGRVTMEVLKYIVYEQAEEVNEEWIAHKEPSEFMDEAVIAIYKEGEAPPEVLEEINKGELPDEIRGQQRAIVEQRQKAELVKAQKIQMEQTRIALQNKAKTKQQQQQQQAGGGENGDGEYDDNDEEDDDDDLAALNTKKRDRRTIEDFEREAKRRRGE